MPKTVEYYLSQGFDRAAAEYYAAGRRTLVAVRPNADFTLTICFDNGERRQLNIKPMLKEGTVFAPLQDPANFGRVYLDAQHRGQKGRKSRADHSAPQYSMEKIKKCQTKPANSAGPAAGGATDSEAHAARDAAYVHEYGCCGGTGAG